MRHAAFVLLTCLSLAGCKTNPPPPRICPGLNLVSTNGAQLFAQSRANYAIVRVLDLDGPILEAQMSDVLKRLDGAVTNDPKNVLFHTKMGDMHMEAGQIDLAAARYEKARALCEDWPPAWIGLADVATHRGQLQQAGDYLRGALGAIDQLQGAAKKKEPEPDFFAILGLNLPKRKDPGKSPRDPKLTEEEALQLAVGWLQESEAWAIENPGLLVPGAGGIPVVKTGSLFRRLRARVEYHYALIEKAKKADDNAVMAKLDKSLEWDPDFFASRLEKAALYRKTRQFQEAERFLRPYVDSQDPKLSNNGRMLYEMAAIYTDWYVADLETSLADQADALYDKLHKLNPNHAEGYIKRAELYLAAGTKLKRADTLKTAVACLDKAKSVTGKESLQAGTLRAEIARAQKNLEKAPTP